MHSKTELLTAIAAGADIIGINHRNLEDFNMDMELAKKLIPLIPNGKIIVAESGLHEREQLEDLRACGAHAFLMGEFFMRQDSIGAALVSMLRSS